MGSSLLGGRALSLIEDRENRLFMSAVSWWELGLKCALRKLDADLPAIRQTLVRSDVEILPLTVAHGEAAAALPLVHRDPFDHMLVAQARFEGMQLLTRDKQLKPYGAAVLCV
jgi:PIN domain nuclease of toxin-antitoxin system